MKKYGLLGHPVKHSYSALMHNSAFRYLNIDAEYQLFDILPNEIDIFLANIREKKIDGCNVTIPHKIAAFEFIKKYGVLDHFSSMIQSVNTIVVKDRLYGYNTDGYGFKKAVEEELKFDFKNKNIFIIGAGGAARAIVMTLEDLPKKIYIDDINSMKSKELAQNYQKFFEKNKIINLSTQNSQERTKYVKECDILINASCIGMKKEDPMLVENDALHENLYIVDIVYNPPFTPLLQAAETKKIKFQNGLCMLLYQGARSFELWTGIKAPIQKMREALQNT